MTRRSSAIVRYLLVLVLGLATFNLMSAAARSAATAQPAQARVALRVEGMHCGGCARGLRTVLTRIEGVIAAEVSFDESRAIVDYDPRRVTVERLIQAIERAGFQARVESGR